LARFAVYKQQILSEEEEQQQQQKRNTDYYLRLEIEEAKILKSWKILQSMSALSTNKY
jgi:hypothetical protein